MSYQNRPSGATYTAYPGQSDGSPDPEPEPEPEFVRSLRGMNWDYEEYWTTGFPLVDRAKSSNDFQPFPSSGATLADFDTDANGFPTETLPKDVGGTNRTLRTQLFTGQLPGADNGSPRYPSGTYVITWAGGTTSSVNVIGDGTTTSTGTRRIERTIVTPTTAGLTLEIASQSDGAPVTEWHCWLPGEEDAAHRYSPDWLELYGHGSAIRMMNAVQCNDLNNRQMSLATKIPVGYHTQMSPTHGMSIEYIVSCANELDKDLWLCIPPRADDAMVTYWLEYCRDNLVNRLYLEGVGNEIWNGFGEFNAQHTYAWTEGVALGLDLVGRFPGDTTEGAPGYQGARFWTAIKWVAYRAAQWFAIAETVYGGKPNGTTRNYERVLGSFVANAAVSDVLCESLIDEDVNGLYNGTDAVADICDGFAIAPYAGTPAIEAAEANHDLSIEDMMDLLCEAGTTEVGGWMTAQGAIATEHGVKIYGYEGGFGAHSFDTVVNDMVRQCRYHPRITEFFENFFAAWDAGGGDLICLLAGVLYPGNINGYWGHMRHQYDDLSDSYLAYVAEVARREAL
jgi:hypothetical protein